jgi:wyosine [tRNA(Phe)-imidazoG37] synthetase (radical SAM superfamily)
MRERKRKKNIQENKSTDLTLHAMLVKHFNMLYLKKYLNKLRESSVVNMLAASPYLYMGRERIAHQHHYEDFDGEREEAFERVLDMADEIKDEMIRGVIKILEKTNQEVTPRRASRQIEEYARKMLIAYTKMAGGHLNH